MQLDEATSVLARGIRAEDAEPGGALQLLATVARKQGDTVAERSSLEELVAGSADNVSALQRLIELCREQSEWQPMLDYSSSLLAVQPMIPAGHEGV